MDLDVGRRTKRAAVILREDGPISLAKRAYRQAKKEAIIMWYRRSAGDGSTWIVQCDGYQMEVDLSDRGIGSSLALNPVREPVSSGVYKDELQRLRKEIDGVITVLEIGANIGYYALIPPTEISDVAVFAIEADSENTELLRRNVELNGFESIFTIDNIALGAQNQVADFYKFDHSNWHTFHNEVDDFVAKSLSESIAVEMIWGEDWLADYDLKPEDIDVIRMDVEGYELEVLRGLPGIFEGRTLAHIEIHPQYLTEDELSELTGLFELHDADVLVAAKGEEEIHIESVENIHQGHDVELVMRFD